MKAKLKVLLKILVSLVCLAAVFFLVDVQKLPSLLVQLKPEVIVLALASMVIGHLGNGLRFHFMINKLGRKLSRLESIKASFVALWFNQILPTGSGGDIVRGFLLADRCGVIRTVLSVLLDRIFGLLWMVLMILICLPIVLHNQLDGMTILLVMLICALVLIASGIPMLSSTALCKRFTNKAVYRFCRYTSLYGNAARKFLSLAIMPRFVFLLCISFFPYVFYIALIGNSFGLQVSLLEYIALVPILFISMNFPISVGGWGVRELTSIYVFSYTGMSNELAIVVSVLYGLGLIVTSVPGNFFWLYHKPVARV